MGGRTRRACRIDQDPRAVNRAVISASVSACGSALANDSLIERFSSSTRHAIFTNVDRMVSNVAPRQRDRRGAASRTECSSQ